MLVRPVPPAAARATGALAAAGAAAVWAWPGQRCLAAGFTSLCAFVPWQAGSYNLLLKLIGSNAGKTIVRKPYYGFSLSPLFIFKCY